MLEDTVGLALFRRVRKNLVLTEAAAVYLPEIRACLDGLEAATLQLLAYPSAGGVLNLAVPATFGTRWLIPRMTEFFKVNPGIIINFNTRNVPFDFAIEGLDAAIYCCDNSVWPGVVADRLMGEEIVPVCSPALTGGDGSLRKPEDLSSFTLLQTTSRPNAWEEWLDAVGVTSVNGRKGPRFEPVPLCGTS